MKTSAEKINEINKKILKTQEMIKRHKGTLEKLNAQLEKLKQQEKEKVIKKVFDESTTQKMIAQGILTSEEAELLK